MRNKEGRSVYDLKRDHRQQRSCKMLMIASDRAGGAPFACIMAWGLHDIGMSHKKNTIAPCYSHKLKYS